ncbi:hypothetical protein FEM48_ZijujUnG0038900 [Ziziphus jujuba var. spinosa]|uniref:BURP domain-containing protein n=1 Tax=Ziziphus jujuba var. spinosa TaxID=714518 RepID=A0A978U9D7_ZIZJJ|nr:hypothetical protein FEM48_ZijujUnG0038900 [Ziziphus jujuba var. spinosa]
MDLEVNDQLEYPMQPAGILFTPMSRLFFETYLHEATGDLTHFSIKPESLEAKAMEDSLKLCEAPAIKGEAKIQEEEPQRYTIGRGTQRVGDKSVACHKLNYVYAVFYCHDIQDTKAYRVPLKMQHQQEDDVAIAVCHSDTSSWNPKHAAFQQLKVKPGIVPICHFLCSDTLFLVNKLLEIK